MLWLVALVLYCDSHLDRQTPAEKKTVDPHFRVSTPTASILSIVFDNSIRDILFEPFTNQVVMDDGCTTFGTN